MLESRVGIPQTKRIDGVHARLAEQDQPSIAMGLLRALEARLSDPDVSDKSGDGYYVRTKDGRKVGPMVGALASFLAPVTDVACQPVTEAPDRSSLTRRISISEPSEERRHR